MNNKEIEIRVQIADSKSLLSFLGIKGEYQGKTFQKDQYFVPAHRNFLESHPIKEWLRLREADYSLSLNYKKWHYESDGKAYHCDEYEVQLDNLEAMQAILVALDFKALITVNKTRSTYRYDDYEIALDQVEDLGDYVEIEYKGDSAVLNSKLLATQMKEFIEHTGTIITAEDYTGYPYLLLNKKHNYKD